VLFQIYAVSCSPLKGSESEMDTQYRHELKHEISYADLLAIRQRLRVVAESDPHAQDGKYLMSSCIVI
jgi:hypothetical protein